MSRRSRHQRTGTAIVRCDSATETAVVAKGAMSASERGACPVAEPWAVDTAVCGERSLPSHEAIAARAREIWESRGRPTGEDLDIWLEAQGQVIEELH